MSAEENIIKDVSEDSITIFLEAKQCYWTRKENSRNRHFISTDRR